MQLYIYAKSGHNFGLENIRRVSAIHNILVDADPVLCSADYRAATFAKAELGVKKGVGIDVIGNLPHAMEKGDMLIFDDSGEASDTMKAHMKTFCTNLYEVGKDIPFDIVDYRFFEESEVKEEKAIFFADDDYSDWFLNLIRTGEKQDMPLVWGHYFFFKNEDETASYFSELREEDGYIDTVKHTKHLLTASVHTALEALASKKQPVFFKRADKLISNFELLEKYNIPVIEADNMDELMKKFDETIANYPTLNPIEKVDISTIKSEIEATLKKFEMIKPALDYKLTN